MIEMKGHSRNFYSKREELLLEADHLESCCRERSCLKLQNFNN